MQKKTVFYKLKTIYFNNLAKTSCRLPYSYKHPRPVVHLPFLCGRRLASTFVNCHSTKCSSISCIKYSARLITFLEKGTEPKKKKTPKTVKSSMQMDAFIIYTYFIDLHGIRGIVHADKRTPANNSKVLFDSIFIHLLCGSYHNYFTIYFFLFFGFRKEKPDALSRGKPTNSGSCSCQNRPPQTS